MIHRMILILSSLLLPLSCGCGACTLVASIVLRVNVSKTLLLLYKIPCLGTFNGYIYGVYERGFVLDLSVMYFSSHMARQFHFLLCLAARRSLFCILFSLSAFPFTVRTCMWRQWECWRVKFFLFLEGFFCTSPVPSMRLHVLEWHLF